MQHCVSDHFQPTLHAAPDGSSPAHVSMVPPCVGLPIGLSPCYRPGIGSTRSAALMTCSQMVRLLSVLELQDNCSEPISTYTVI